MEYAVLSPWADIKPVQFCGISPRLTDLEGKTIGLLGYFKKWARPILNVIEEKIHEKYPTAAFSYYVYSEHNSEILNSPHKDEFIEWVRGVDGVISAYGD